MVDHLGPEDDGPRGYQASPQARVQLLFDRAEVFPLVLLNPAQTRVQVLAPGGQFRVREGGMGEGGGGLGLAFGHNLGGASLDC
jgi:hypothetical protein